MGGDEVKQFVFKHDECGVLFIIDIFFDFRKMYRIRMRQGYSSS